jgi:hypothetical protein
LPFSDQGGIVIENAYRSQEITELTYAFFACTGTIILKSINIVGIKYPKGVIAALDV